MGGKDLCEKHGVQGFPTIKYGDPDDLKDYSGGRSFEDLKKFADENLGPQCGPEHGELCSDSVREKINKFLAMSEERLSAKIVNAVRIVEEEVPIMKKVVAHMKKGGKKTTCRDGKNDGPSMECMQKPENFEIVHQLTTREPMFRSAAQRE